MKMDLWTWLIPPCAIRFRRPSSAARPTQPPSNQDSEINYGATCRSPSASAIILERQRGKSEPEHTSARRILPHEPIRPRRVHWLKSICCRSSIIVPLTTGNDLAIIGRVRSPAWPGPQDRSATFLCCMRPAHTATSASTPTACQAPVPTHPRFRSLRRDHDRYIAASVWHSGR